MSLTASPRFLPAVLWADAASCIASGALQVTAAPLLATWLGLPATLLTTTGWFLFGVAAFAIWLARSRPVARAGVFLLVAGNVAWVLGCLELAVTGAAGTTLGVAFLVAQALAVGTLAALEFTAVRRVHPTAWA